MSEHESKVDISFFPSVEGYRIIEELGHGGMGTVYKAEGPDGTLVAVKIAHEDCEDPTAYVRFAREASLKVQHKNLVRVLDSGTTGKTPYVVLDYLVGETLYEILRRGPLTGAEALDLGVQMCDGLAAAHGEGVVHRDLKPSNIIRCEDGTFVLLDFGVAIWNTDDTRMTTHGKVIGTPAYLSPEQARGEVDIDQGADLWSLGVVLYEAVSGTSPFQRDALLATMLSVVMDEPVPLGRACPEAPIELQNAVRCALSKQRSNRWESAEKFREALVSVASEAGTTESPDLGPDPEPELSEGERRLVAVLLAEECNDPRALGHAVAERGGVFLELREASQSGLSRAVGIFGGISSQGDELLRAAQVALDSRSSAKRIAVASGHTVGRRSVVSGATLAAAEEASGKDVPGVAVAPNSARALARLFEVRVYEETHVIVGTRERFGLDALQIGRDLEQAQILREVGHSLEDGELRMALISGPRGIGKSTLLHHVDLGIREDFEQVTILRASAEGIDRERAHSLIASLMHEHLRQEVQQQDESAELDVDTIEATMDFLDGAARSRCAEFIADLIGVSTRDSPQIRAALADARLRQDQLRLAIRDYFSAMAGERQIVFLLEDLHWADTGSIELLQDVMPELHDCSVALVATALPENEASYRRLFSEQDSAHVVLRPLRKSQVAKLAEAIAGRPLAKEVAQVLADRSAGNPLFIEHLVHDYLDNKALTLQASTMPPTVEAAVQSHLDNIGDAAKEVCKRAALFGRDVSAAALSFLGIEDPEPLLELLVRRGVLSKVGGRSGEDYFRFRNSLVADVAYGMLLERQREKGHQGAAQYLSTRDPGASQEIALHFEKARAFPDAAVWYAKAARAASIRGDAQTVLRSSERVFQLAPSSKTFDLHMVRSDAFRFLGRREEQVEELREASKLAASPVQRAQAATELAWTLSRTGETEQALLVAESAVAAALEADDNECIALALGWRSVVHAQLGKLDVAVDDLQRATRAGRGVSAKVDALSVEWQAQVAAARGDLAERLSAFRAVEAQYVKNGDVRRAAGAACNVADIYNRLGDFAQAETALRLAREACRRAHNRLVEGYTTVNLAYSLMNQDRREEALTELAAAMELAHETKETMLQVVVGIYRSRTDLGAADDVEVAGIALRAARDAEDLGAPPLIAMALTIASSAQRRAGKLEVALTYAKRAMEIRDQLCGLEEGEADLFVTLARCYEACGQNTEAESVRRRGRDRMLQIAKSIRDEELRRTFLSVPSRAELVAD